MAGGAINSLSAAAASCWDALKCFGGRRACGHTSTPSALASAEGHRGSLPPSYYLTPSYYCTEGCMAGYESVASGKGDARVSQ
jgi:hypothetical protein